MFRRTSVRDGIELLHRIRKGQSELGRLGVQDQTASRHLDRSVVGLKKLRPQKGAQPSRKFAPEPNLQ